MRTRALPEMLNRVANAPEVIRGLAPGYLAIDLKAFFDSPENVMFGDDRGVVMFVRKDHEHYEMHYLMTRCMRGKAGLLAIKEAIRELFTYHAASVITGSTPRENRAARLVNRALGGRPYGVCVDSQGRDCINYVLERQTWVRFSGA